MLRLIRSWGLVLLLGLGSAASSAPLAIGEMALTDGEISWNGKAQWGPGEKVWVRVILVGLRRGADGRIAVRESLELRDAAGELLLEARDLVQIERQVPDEVSSIELVNHFIVPDGLSPGTYQATVRCDDDVAGSSVSRDVPFVLGPGPGGGLRIPRFSLEPLPGEGTGRLGDKARAEASLVGYRTDSQGRYWIEADVTLTDPSGQLALRWENILEKHERSEPSGVPLRLSLLLELPAQYEPGDYRIELRIRDRLAETEALQSATWTKR